MSVHTETQVFCLLTLPKCSLRSFVFQADGELEVQSVTMSASPENQLAADHVCIVFKCGIQEIPIEPSRICVVSNSGHTFVFQPTRFDYHTLVLDVQDGDAEILHNILGEYCDLHTQDIQGVSDVKQPIPPDMKQPFPADVKHPIPPAATGFPTPRDIPTPDDAGPIIKDQHRPDLAGHLILINEDNGQIVGEVSDTANIQEQNLGKHDPVIVEIDENDTGTAMEVFVRTIPVHERDWITWGAIGASKVITGSTTLLISGVSAAGNYYMKRSKSNNAQDPVPSTSATSSATSAKAIAMLNSSKTKANLETAHKYSGKARVLSGKTVKLVDEMITRAVGTKPSTSSKKSLSKAPQPPTTSMRTPQYTNTPPEPTPPAYQEKPPLPPRGPIPHSPYPTYTPGGLKPALPPRSVSPSPQFMQTAAAGPSTPQQSTTNKKARLMLSVNLILDTIDHNTKRLLEAGTTGVGTIVGHTYGKDAGENTLLAAGAVKNVALVYVDVKGFTHRAILKRAGKHYIKSKISSNKAAASKAGAPQTMAPA